MINLKLLKNCKSLKKQIQKDGKLSFCTDTRRYIHPSAFVAIPGAKVNPLDVIDELLGKKCPLVFFQHDDINEKKVENLRHRFPETEFVSVLDSVTFLQELSHEHIKEWKTHNARNTVFAISGSNGKTTHKEMLSFLLKEVIPDKIISTEKNNNNHLGVPLTLLGVTDKTEVVVLELGSNHPGEIKVLCDIALPNAGITTNIGATHMEFFGTEEKVFDEEAYLYYAIKNVTSGKGFYLINIDDTFLKTLSPTEGSITYGESPNAMAKVSLLEDGAEIIVNNNHLRASNAFITGGHNKLNLITCLFIATQLYPEHKSKFIEACKNFRPTKNRSEWIQFEGRSVYLDAYNANPSSMRAALQGFKESVLSQGFKLSEACIVLGDMNELGDTTPQYHKDLGVFVNELGFDNVYFVGRFAHFYLEGYSKGRPKNSSAEFKSEYRNECLKQFPIHFIKGSRSLQLESLFDIT
jgi:UDP-N-acetylmuramoyl-tripeptide--D-alanyl-D-alanine ligase